MSDIRFNQWLHNSGTGGVSQVDGGHVGIGTTNPLIPVGSGNTAILNVGVVTANSFYGDGSNLSGVQVGGASSLSFNDNIGAYFGNSQDLKIYHDGNHSYVDDQGTGNLRFRSGTLEILNLAGNKTSAIFSSGGGQTLNFNNGARFVTTNEGATFSTGSSSCVVRLTSNNSSVHILQAFNNDLNIKAPSSGGINLLTNASNTSLAITSSGQTKLNISSNGALTEPLVLRNGGTGAGTNVGMVFYNGDESSSGAGALAKIKAIDEGSYDGALVFETASKSGWSNTGTSERVRITSAGKFGIGTSNPSQELTVYGTDPIISVQEASASSQVDIGTGTVQGFINIQKADGTRNVQISSDGDTYFTGGDFGIGTNSPDRKLDVSGTGNVYGKFQSTNTTGAGIEVKDSSEDWLIQADGGVGPGLAFYDLGRTSYRMNINSSGKVGINKTSPSWMLDIENPNPGNDSKQAIQRWVNGGQNTLELNMYGGTVDQCQFAATNSEQTISFLTGRNTGSQVVSTETTLLMTQNRDLFNQGPDTGNYGGGLFIGRSASPYGNLAALRDNNHRPIIYLAGRYPEISLIHEVPSNTSHAAGIRFATYVQSTNTATGNQFVIGTNGPGTYLDIGHATAGQNKNVHAGISNHSGTTRFRVTTSGCQVFGSFSKSSGSFKIPHPLPEKTETHELVHSFIEGPQADLIYRGVVDLVDGTATVNVDTAGRMTQGTFVALCTNVSCFTSNETDWTAVKGSISGNILTITAQDNTSTATVSWMVVGERKDQHMKDTNWTDDNGRVITEPLKSS